MTVLKTPAIAEVPPWIAVALGEVGVLEDTRAGRSTKRIEQYHGVTRAGTAADDVPWCSSFVCWCFEQCGISSTRSKSAASWATWGMPVLTNRAFSVVVFGRNDKDARGTGHVALSLGVSAKEIYVIGGNQRQRVSIATRLVSDVVTCRWPLTKEAIG